jgi:hypothetical protein
MTISSLLGALALAAVICIGAPAAGRDGAAKME